ncbi:hypothetical protein ACFL2M_02280 [Patescibacteria group bacterium]
MAIKSRKRGQLRRPGRIAPPTSATRARAIDDVEELPRQQLEREQTTVLPTSAENLLEATFGEAGRGALNELSITFARSERALELVMEIEERLERYLGNLKTGPSIYAKSVTEAVQPAAHVTSERQAALIEVRRHILAEINPLLLQLMQAAQDDPLIPAALGTEEGLLAALQVGEVKNQKTASFFGLLKGLDISEPDIPRRKKIVVVDPLSRESQEAYWAERLRCTEVYGDASLPQLIARSSFALQYELKQAAQRIPEIDKLLARAQEKNFTPTTEEAEVLKLYRAYEIVHQWIEAKTAPLEGAPTKDEFDEHIRRLDFLHGDAAAIFDVLNACQVIKSNNPELYVRMLGVDTRPESAEAGKSDLFGSAFHIAVYRSMHMEISENRIGLEVLKRRLEGLTEMDKEQLPLLYVNDEQMEEMENRIKADLEKYKETGSAIGSTVQAVILAMTYPNYELRKMLDSVSLKEREHNLARLRVCGPDEFFRIIREMPESVVEDEDVIDIFLERLPSQQFEQEVESKADNAEGTVGEITTRRIAHLTLAYPETHQASFRVEEVIGFIRGNFTEMSREGKKQWKLLSEPVLRLDLLKTAADEEMLSFAFFQEIFQLSKKLDGLSRSRDDKLKGRAYDQLRTTLLETLAAHPDITDNDWLDWIHRMIKENGEAAGLDRFMGYSDRSLQILGQKQPARHTLHSLFQHLPPTVVEAGPKSRFFSIMPETRTDSMHIYEKRIQTWLKTLKRVGKLPVDTSGIPSPVWFFLYNLHEMGDDLASDESEENLALLRDPMRKEALYFRTHHESLATERLQILQDGLLNQFMGALEPEERKHYLRACFKDEEYYEMARTIKSLFEPEHPWQLELLNWAESLIPDDPGYQKFAAEVAAREEPTVEEVREKVRSQPLDRHVSDVAINNESPMFSFRNPQTTQASWHVHTKLLPRFVREDGLWAAEHLDERTGQWKRIKTAGFLLPWKEEEQ